MDGEKLSKRVSVPLKIGLRLTRAVNLPCLQVIATSRKGIFLSFPFSIVKNMFT